MNKIFKTALFFAFATTMSIAFTSCSEGKEDITPNISNVTLNNVTQQYVTNVVYPAYSNLAANAEQLFNKLGALRTKLNANQAVQQSEIDELCKLYKDARMYWEASEAFLYGPATDFKIDDHIDTWPLDVKTLAKDLADHEKIARLNTDYNIETTRKEITSDNLGFHGIEFVLFRDGKNRNATFFNNNTIEDNANFKDLNVTAKEEVIYAYAVAGDLADKCYQLEVSWMGNKANAAHIARIKALSNLEDFQTTTGKGLSYGDNLLTAGSATSDYPTFKKVMEQIFIGGCSNICGEVADQKLGQAYNAITNPGSKHEEEDENGNKIQVENSRDYIESPYSHNSFNDFYDNIMSIQNSLYGNFYTALPHANSIMTYLILRNPKMATELNTRLVEALKALQACKDSGKSFVEDPASQNVKNAMDKVANLDEYFAEVSAWVLEN